MEYAQLLNNLYKLGSKVKTTESIKMKFQNHILLIIPIVCATVSIYSQESIVITGRVINPKDSSIYISIPRENQSSWAFEKKINLNGEGNFCYKVKASGYGVFYIWHGIIPFNVLSAQLILKPGDTCFILLNANNSEVEIVCNNNNDGLNLYKVLQNKHLQIKISKNFRTDPNSKNSFDDYSPYQIRDTILILRTNELDLVNKLFKAGKIDEPFKTILFNEISYFYDALSYDWLGEKVFFSQFPENHPKHIELSEESLSLVDSTLSMLFLPLDKKDITYSEIKTDFSLFNNSQELSQLCSGDYLHLIDKYIHYKGYYLPHRNESFDLNAVNTNFHKYNLELYSKYLSGKDFENSVANYFYQWFHKTKMANDLIKPYVNFRMYYPKNPYIPFIDSLVEQNDEFNKISTAMPVEGVVFINSDSIRDFKRLLHQFKGSVLYIDIWATTCSPCIAEFKFYPDFYKFALINDIKILFISFDRKRETEIWKKTIIKNNLKGFHLIASEDLKKDITKTINLKGIPWYIVVDKNGTISDEFILRPSFTDKLYNQILKYIAKE